MTHQKSNDPREIFLQPDLDPLSDRPWCEDDDPSGQDGPWVRYVRGDIADDLRDALKVALAHVNKISPSQRQCEDLALGRAAIAKAKGRNP